MNGKYWGHFKLPDKSQFDTGLSNFINNGKFRTTNLNFMNFIKKMYDGNGSTYSWDNLLVLIDIRIKSQTGSDANINEIVSLYDFFWLIMSLSDENKNAGDSILRKQHVNQGFLMHFFRILADEPRIENTAKLLFYYLSTVPNCPPPTSNPGKAIMGYDHLKKDIFINPQNHDVLNNHLNNLFSSQNRFDLYIDIWNQTPDSRKWISYCLYLLSKSTRIKEIDTTFILTNWEILNANLGNHWHDFLGSVIGKTTLLENLQDQNFDIALSSQIQEIINYSKSKKIKGFSTKIIKQIRGTITKDTWFTELKNSNSYLLSLVSKLHENKYTLNLGLPFSEALINYGENMISGTIQTCINTECFSYIGSINDRKYLHSQLFNTLINSKGNIPPIFFECFGKELMDKEVINNKTEFIENFIIQLLEQKNISGLQWFAEFLMTEPDLFKGSYSIEIFKTKLSETLKEELEDNFRETLQRISSLLVN